MIYTLLQFGKSPYTWIFNFSGSDWYRLKLSKIRWSKAQTEFYESVMLSDVNVCGLSDSNEYINGPYKNVYHLM